MRRGLRGAVLALPMLLGAGAGGDPLYSGNHAPPGGLLGFPAMRDATVLARGAFRAEFHAALANQHSRSSHGGEAIRLDGETLSWSGRAAYGLGGGWDVEVGAAWVRHSGGVLDRWIEGWHDLWGLPDGDRPGTPRDRIDFAYDGPATRFALREASAGLGSARVALTRSLWRRGAHALSVRAGVKLGVGDERNLLAGGDDGHVSLQWTRADPTPGLAWHAQVGWLRAGRSRVLGTMANRSPWFAGMGLEWPAWRRLHLKLQLDAHGPVADSALRELGDPSALLTVGGTWTVGPRWQVEFGFTEDIAPRTAPDFTPRLGFRYRAGGR